MQTKFKEAKRGQVGVSTYNTSFALVSASYRLAPMVPSAFSVSPEKWIPIPTFSYLNRDCTRIVHHLE